MVMLFSGPLCLFPVSVFLGDLEEVRFGVETSAVLEGVEGTGEGEEAFFHGGHFRTGRGYRPYQKWIFLNNGKDRAEEEGACHFHPHWQRFLSCRFLFSCLSVSIFLFPGLSFF